MNEPMEVAFAPDRLAVLLRHFAELAQELARRLPSQGGPAPGELRHDRHLRRLRRDRPNTTSISCAASVTSITACRAPAGCAI